MHRFFLVKINPIVFVYLKGFHHFFLKNPDSLDLYDIWLSLECPIVGLTSFRNQNTVHVLCAGVVHFCATFTNLEISHHWAWTWSMCYKLWIESVSSGKRFFFKIYISTFFIIDCYSTCHNNLVHIKNFSNPTDIKKVSLYGFLDKNTGEIWITWGTWKGKIGFWGKGRLYQ